MKNLKKLITMLVSTFMLAMMFVGCGGPKITPDESAMIALDILMKGDNSKLDSIGMTQEEFDKTRKQIEDNMMSEFESSIVGLSIKEETKTNLFNSMLEAVEKLEYEASTLSQDKKEAKVELKIKAIDFKKVSEELNKDIKAYVTENPTITRDELLDYTFNKEAELIRNGYTQETPTSITLTLTNEGNVWSLNKSDIEKIENAIVAY